MLSPFPGMDPYLEATGIWQDFHDHLAPEIAARLNPLIRPRYYAALVPYVTYEEVEIAAPRGGRPDVGVLHLHRAEDHGPVSVAIAPPPAESRILLEFPLRLHSVEVRAAGNDVLVTSIEILSPVNKQPGHEAFDAYRRKRRALLHSDVHLMEIDLLRKGERPPLVDPVPPAPYYVTLGRAQRRPVVEVWPLRLQEPLPTVPVPLLPPDPDVPLDLGAAVAAIYERGAYDLRIDYRQPPPLPPLLPEDEAWVHERLRNLREPDTS
ncbi:MAG: DUF4058 family protein [Anaerolineae bacterium]